MDTNANLLPDDVESLKRIIVSMRGELGTAIREKAELKILLEREQAKYEDLKREIFGRTSEKVKDSDSRQGELFNEAERDAGIAPLEEKVQVIKRHIVKKPGSGRQRPGPELERIEKRHDLSDEEKRCPCCGKDRPVIGEERSEEIEIIPARAIVVVHVRPKYGPCPCDGFGVTGAKAIITAPAPAKIVSGSMFSNHTIAFIIVGKYGDGMPLYRQEQSMGRLGLEISRGTMARLVIKTGSALAPVVDAMKRDLLLSPVVRMDETPVQVLKEPGRPAHSQSRMWAAMGYRESSPILLFVYNQSRSKEVAKAIRVDYKGFLQTDGYGGYTEIGMREGITHVGCWAHIRREFHGIYVSQKSPLALEAIKQIRELYTIEDELRDKLDKGAITASGFMTERKERSGVVFKYILEWLTKRQQEVPPRSPMGDAIAYALGQYERAVRYVDHILLTPDNNLIENAIRPFVIGRKNWLFCDTQDGAWASSTFYSIVETARANGHEPYRYLCYLFDRLPGTTTTKDIDALLPYNLKPLSY